MRDVAPSWLVMLAVDACALLVVLALLRIIPPLLFGTSPSGEDGLTIVVNGSVGPLAMCSCAFLLAAQPIGTAEDREREGRQTA